MGKASSQIVALKKKKPMSLFLGLHTPLKSWLSFLQDCGRVCYWPVASISAAHTPGSVSLSGPQTARPSAACSWAGCRASSTGTRGRPSPGSDSQSRLRETCGSSRRQSRTIRWLPSQWYNGSNGANGPQRAQSLRDSYDSAAADTSRCSCLHASGSPQLPPWWCCRRKRVACSLCQPCWLLGVGSLNKARSLGTYKTKEASNKNNSHLFLEFNLVMIVSPIFLKYLSAQQEPGDSKWYVCGAMLFMWSSS